MKVGTVRRADAKQRGRFLQQKKQNTCCDVSHWGDTTVSSQRFMLRTCSVLDFRIKFTFSHSSGCGSQRSLNFPVSWPFFSFPGNLIMALLYYLKHTCRVTLLRSRWEKANHSGLSGRSHVIFAFYIRKIFIFTYWWNIQIVMKQPKPGTSWPKF